MFKIRPEPAQVSWESFLQEKSPLLHLGWAFHITPKHITSNPACLVSEGQKTGLTFRRCLPCSGKVGAGLAVQSVAVTSTAQKRRHFQLHIPVPQLEVGDKAPHLHGDSALSWNLLFKLTLRKEKNKNLGGSVLVGGRARSKRS